MRTFVTFSYGKRFFRCVIWIGFCIIWAHLNLLALLTVSGESLFEFPDIDLLKLFLIYSASFLFPFIISGFVWNDLIPDPSKPSNCSVLPLLLRGSGFVFSFLPAVYYFMGDHDIQQEPVFRYLIWISICVGLPFWFLGIMSSSFYFAKKLCLNVFFLAGYFSCWVGLAVWEIVPLLFGTSFSGY